MGRRRLNFAQTIEPARKAVFFVDAYLDADFDARTLPDIYADIPIRLLARDKLPTYRPKGKTAQD